MDKTEENVHHDDGNEFISPVDINEIFNNLQKRSIMLVTQLQFGMRIKVYIYCVLNMVQKFRCVFGVLLCAREVGDCQRWAMNF